jgi:hypothetical protein
MKPQRPLEFIRSTNVSDIADNKTVMTQYVAALRAGDASTVRA